MTLSKAISMIRLPGIIPISIYPFFWILAVGIGWLNTFNFLGTAIWTAVILISVLVHEYGHALTAMFFGQRAQIDLVAFGGVTKRYGPKPKLWQEFIIVMNGPLAGFLLGAFAYYLATDSSTSIGYAIFVAFYVNIFWTILNLVPILPLDGGKLLSIVLESIFGLRGLKTALFLSLIFAAVFGLIFFAFKVFFVGAIFLMLGFENYRSWKESMAVTEHDQNAEVQDLLKDAENEIHRGDKDQALEKLQHIRELTKGGVLFINASEQAASILAEKGNIKGAYDILLPISNKIGVNSLRLLHQLAYKQEEWEKAVSIGTQAYQAHPSYDTALLNALCLSILGKAQPAIGWLQSAIRDGLPNLRDILQRREFDNIRDTALFSDMFKKS